jgi:hypothetical protein
LMEEWSLRQLQEIGKRWCQMPTRAKRPAHTVHLIECRLARG